MLSITHLYKINIKFLEKHLKKCYILYKGKSAEKSFVYPIYVHVFKVHSGYLHTWQSETHTERMPGIIEKLHFSQAKAVVLFTNFLIRETWTLNNSLLVSVSESWCAR